MDRSDIDIFEKLVAQLSSIHQEMSVLAKRAPNDAVNAFKIKLINAAISRSNELLGERCRPFSDFTSFSAEDLPSNSDVTFIVSQYLECAEKFRSDNIADNGMGDWYWITKENPYSLPTAPPKKLEG